MPPPSSGGVHLIQMLNVLEGFDLAEWGWGSAAAVHRTIEAMKFAYADRSVFLGDSDFVDVPLARLTSKEYAETLRARIQPDRAIPRADVSGVALDGSESTDTTHVSVVDADGDAVAATLTINLTFGSAWVAGGTGVVLNDEMDDFSAAPGVPNAFGLVGSAANAIAPGKRPLSSMTPTLGIEEGKVRLVLGSPGGSRIITTVLQVLINVVDFGMDIEQAVRAPRFHHQWTPESVDVEPLALSPDTSAKLRAMGHALEQAAPFCNAQCIEIDASGVREGASDPRGVGRPAGL
jgi:gamma-glutamyltranspeptidase/glutathione hydrolase